MYLIEYTDPRDPGAYQVRSFDLATGELDPDPILDSEEEPGDMRGFPQTRATSPDGGWEYTLYDGGGAHPFIHALDVVEGATVCIDLEMLKPKDTYGATLADVRATAPRSSSRTARARSGRSSTRTRSRQRSRARRPSPRARPPRKVSPASRRRESPWAR